MFIIGSSANVHGSPGAPGLAAAARSSGNAGVGSFVAELSVRVANFKSQAFETLTGSAQVAGKANDSAGLPDFLAQQFSPAAWPTEAEATTESATAASGLAGLSASGRNTALFDPESAYRMMTVINRADVLYKAEFAELSQMQSRLDEMQQVGQSLAGLGTVADDAGVKAQIQQFVADYNDWSQRFDEDMRPGGLLAGTQAAQVSRHELEQNVQSHFHGAKAGVHGLRDLGVSIDPRTRLATFDGARLDATLAANPAGVIAAVQEFGANLARSAELLNSANNFIDNRLDRLDDVIDYIADNQSSLQAEFGLGDPAKPAGKVAQALAAYQQMQGV